MTPPSGWNGNICTVYGLNLLRPRCDIPHTVVENNKAKILWDIQIKADRQFLANEPDIEVIEKKTVVMIDEAVSNGSKIRKEEDGTLVQGLKEELEMVWKVKAKVILAIGVFWAVTLKLVEGLQEIPGTTAELWAQKNKVLGTPKLLDLSLSYLTQW